MKTFFKWVFWGIVGIIGAVWLYDVWQNKNEIEKQFVWLFAAFIYMGWVLSKEIDKINEKQDAILNRLTYISTLIDERTPFQGTNDMLYEFLRDNRDKKKSREKG